MRSRRGQAIVEVLVLAPIVVACVGAFVISCTRLTAMARAEAALANAVAADASGASVAGAIAGRARLVRLDSERIEIAVEAPLGTIRLSGRRVR